MIILDKLILVAKETAIMRAQLEVNDVFDRQLEEIRRQIKEREKDDE